MNPEKAEAVADRLSKAWECLNEVTEVLIENELWNTSINRLYYASYHAVAALLTAYDIDTKTHTGAKQMFSLHFIKPGIIEEQIGALYANLFSMRQKADYEYQVEYEKDHVMDLIEPVIMMINTIEDIVSLK